MVMLPCSSTAAARPRPQGMLIARLQLHMLRCSREHPCSCVILLLAFACLPALLAMHCMRKACTPCCTSELPISQISAIRPISTDMPFVLPRDDDDDTARPISMADVVVGIMTCRRFHPTRCRAQSDTWLRRARRVVFFTDTFDDSASAELQAPAIAHAFSPSATERIFAGGNWRAVPILRALAEGFFSEAAQRSMAARHETLPKWVYMADDDSYAFTSTMLATLAKYDADKPHYLGYAFIAAPHLEGVIPGKRQPMFANGGAGICVSRGALVAALPLFARCESDYRWNWPGDVRLAQCLLDAGIKVEWLKTFHAEAPGVIIHKQRPPPGSVPVGLHLPPLSFHHVDADMLHSLHRMQSVPVTLREWPHDIDFSLHAFQPLSATHPTNKQQLQMHFGFEVMLLDGPYGRNSRPGDYLASFAVAASQHGDSPLQGAVAMASKDSWSSHSSTFVQTFTGGECRQDGRLMGGLSSRVITHCGRCADNPDGGQSSWSAAEGETGLRICNFTVSGCETRVHVALEPGRCPVPMPRKRLGLDAGSQPGWADVVCDGQARGHWRASCGETHVAEGSGNGCRTVRVQQGSTTNLTLWFRVFVGNTVVQLLDRGGLTISSLADEEVAASTAVHALQVQVAKGSSGTLLLSGAVASLPETTTVGTAEVAAISAKALEPGAASITLLHSCGAAGEEQHSFGVRARFSVSDHIPIELGWAVRCEPPER